MVRAALFLALLSATAPAFAEGPVPQPRSRVALASVVVQRSATELLAGQRSRTMGKPVRREFVGGLTLTLAPSPALVTVTPDVIPDMGPQNTKAKSKSTVDYKSLIGQLALARDLQIPGSSTMAVRLIPARQALAGETSPIVFTPRVVGTSWYGLDVAARF